MTKVARLLDMIVPERYVLDVFANPDKPGFRVEETITFELKRASGQLTLHAVGLNISDATLETGAHGLVAFDATAQTATISFTNVVESGRHTLKLRLTGTAVESLHGFYRSRYTHEGRQKWLLTTQFEPGHAREAFVCIDEPAAKAVFEVNLTIPRELTALSNAAVLEETMVSNDQKRVRFAPTPKMSTYLVAYIVGEFEYIERQTPEGVLVRAYATPGRQSQLEFALDTGIRGLTFYQQFYGIPYPLSKLDMIAVPDFAAGAMENWGLVTYRETALLLDSAQTSLGQKQRVAEVVLHELAHQWFGNFVTMMWWNDLWLNEGFATWGASLAMDALFPEWQAWVQFISDETGRALTDDALANTHAIEVEVEDPRAVDEIFDGISYAKGASIINMLYTYLGAEAFQRGLQLYLTNHQYGNAVTIDLWDALAEASGQPVAEIMSNWTGQPGYPILEFANGQVRQQRFYASPREATKAKHTAGQLWRIPLSIQTSSGEVVRLLLTEETTRLPDSVIKAAWFKPNAGQTGFYRSLYTADLIGALEPPLTDGTLPETDRFGVVSDELATTEAGLTSSTAALELLQVLRQETSYVVWGVLSAVLTSILAITEDETLRRQLEAFGGWFVDPALQRFGWEARPSDTPFDTLMRPMVLSLAVRFDNAAATAEAKHRFTTYLDTGKIDPDTRSAVYYAVARHGSAADFDTLLDLYRKEDIPQVKLTLLATLSRFRKPELIQRSLDFSLSSEVRSQDTIYSVAYALLNRDGKELAWKFVQEHWSVFLERYGDGGHMLDNFPSYVGMAFADHAKAKDVKAFYSQHPHPAITRSVAQAVESIDLKADWAERDHDAVGQFLAAWLQTGRAA